MDQGSRRNGGGVDRPGRVPEGRRGGDSEAAGSSVSLVAEGAGAWSANFVYWSRQRAGMSTAPRVRVVLASLNFAGSAQTWIKAPARGLKLELAHALGTPVSGGQGARRSRTAPS